jgi:hypothetical protein
VLDSRRFAAEIPHRYPEDGMIKIELERTLPYQRSEVFTHFENIQSLSTLKKDVKSFSLVRDEPGLQIADSHIRLPFFLSFKSRLSCTTRLEKYCELKQVKGDFREYLCIYKLSDSPQGTSISVSLVIRFPLGPAALLAYMVAPLMRRRLEGELHRIEKQESARAL